MDIKDLEFALIKATEQMEENYKETLNKYQDRIDNETWNALYDLGADIKHTFEEINRIIVKHLEK